MPTFHFIPKTTDDFARFFFWHSLSFTLTTPLTRLITKRWQYVVTVPYILGSEDSVTEAYPEPEVLDRSWIPHATFGLLWVAFGSTQFTNVKKHSRLVHKLMGVLALLVYCGHVSAAGYTLYSDHLKHTFVNKIFLASDLVSGTWFIFEAMLNVLPSGRAKKGWLQRHKDYMFVGFVTSIEGSGTIRTISLLQYLIDWAGLDRRSFLYAISGAGVRECQMKWRHVGEHCQWEYSFRMFWIRFLSNLYVQCYASFTPTAAPLAQKRWKDWVVLFSVFVFCIDQDVTPMMSFALYVIIWLLLDRPWMSEEEKRLRNAGLLKGKVVSAVTPKEETDDEEELPNSLKGKVVSEVTPKEEAAEEEEESRGSREEGQTPGGGFVDLVEEEDDASRPLEIDIGARARSEGESVEDCSLEMPAAARARSEGERLRESDDRQPEAADGELCPTLLVERESIHRASMRAISLLEDLNRRLTIGGGETPRGINLLELLELGREVPCGEPEHAFSGTPTEESSHSESAKTGDVSPGVATSLQPVNGTGLRRRRVSFADDVVGSLS